jgi:hypothetical protein
MCLPVPPNDGSDLLALSSETKKQILTTVLKHAVSTGK